MKCLICKKSETVKFLDDYKLEITGDNCYIRGILKKKL